MRLTPSALHSSLALKWVKVNDSVLETECGNFRCRKYWTGDDVLTDAGELRYQLYGPDGMRLGPPAISFIVARAHVAQWHGERKRA
jgi:hypothetical protein